MADQMYHTRTNNINDAHTPGIFYGEVLAAELPTSKSRKQALFVMREKLKDISILSDRTRHPILLERLVALQEELTALLERMKFSPILIVRA
jgi:hypothetical protein